MSLDPQINADIPALIGASAAVTLTGAPFNGPVGAVRVGYIDGNYVINPSTDQLLESALNLVVAGTSTSVLMVESEARQLSEEVMLGAVMFGHEQFQVAIDNIKALAEEVGVVAWNWQSEEKDQALVDEVVSRSTDLLREAYAITDKLNLNYRIIEFRNDVVAAITEAASLKCSSS